MAQLQFIIGDYLPSMLPRQCNKKVKSSVNIKVPSIASIQLRAQNHVPGCAMTIFKMLSNHSSKLIKHPDLPGILSGHLAMLCSAGDRAPHLFSPVCPLGHTWFALARAAATACSAEDSLQIRRSKVFYLPASDHAQLCGRLCLSATSACYIYHLPTPTYLPPTYLPTTYLSSN